MNNPEILVMLLLLLAVAGAVVYFVFFNDDDEEDDQDEDDQDDPECEGIVDSSSTYYHERALTYKYDEDLGECVPKSCSALFTVDDENYTCKHAFLSGERYLLMMRMNTTGREFDTMIRDILITNVSGDSIYDYTLNFTQNNSGNCSYSFNRNTQSSDTTVNLTNCQ